MHLSNLSKQNRKFWLENLPRLKYHNPSTPIIVNRHTNNDQPPKLSIFLNKLPASSSSSSPEASTPEKRSQAASSRDNLSPLPIPDFDERLVTVDVTAKHSSYILEMLLAETRAVVVSPTREEVREMQRLQALQQQAEVDRERVRQLRAEEKREEEMLKRARAAGGMAEQEA